MTKWYLTSPDVPEVQFPICDVCNEPRHSGHTNCSCPSNHPDPCDRPTYRQLLERSHDTA